MPVCCWTSSSSWRCWSTEDPLSTRYVARTTRDGCARVVYTRNAETWLAATGALVAGTTPFNQVTNATRRARDGWRHRCGFAVHTAGEWRAVLRPVTGGRPRSGAERCCVFSCLRTLATTTGEWSWNRVEYGNMLHWIVMTQCGAEIEKGFSCSRRACSFATTLITFGRFSTPSTACYEGEY